MDIVYKTINNEQGDEIFTNGLVTWNISKLMDYLVESKDFLYKLSKDKYNNLISGDQAVDEVKIDLVDLNKPIIIAIDKRGHNLIDGIHRVRKAEKNNCEYILAYILPFEEHVKFVASRADFIHELEINTKWNCSK